MPGERIDYGIDRQRHESFIGRAALLAQLDQLLTQDRTDRWVLVTGGPGMTPDGRRMISGSEDRTLTVWDVASGRCVATLEGHTDRVHGCAVTPDGRRMISVSEDRTLRVWDLDDHYTCLLVHRGDVAYTAVAPTPTAVIAGDRAGTVWFLDWPTSGEPPRPPATPCDPAITGGSAAASPGTAARLARTAPTQHVILFLAANPDDTTRLDLDDECAAIERELSMTPARHDFDFHSKWAVDVHEMMRHFNELQPSVIHVSGHGATEAGAPGGPRGGSRDIEPAIQGAIIVEGERRQRRQIHERALAQMIASAAPSARVVVLNACYSAALADALCRVVDCVVGMRGAISDGAALVFAVAFYRALGHRCSVGNAVDQARATLAAMQLPDEHLPVLRTRPGLDPGELFLG